MSLCRRAGVFFGHPYLSVLCRFILGLIFLRASMGKIGHAPAFADIVEEYHILPLFLVNFFAVVLLWVEMISGIGLVIGALTRANAFILTGLLVMFMIALSINVLRGVDMDCGCFDLGGGESIQGALVRDVFFLVLGLQVLFFDRGVLSLDGVLERWKVRKLES